MLSAESQVKPVPSCIEIGLEASRKGNFQMARQMFRTAMQQLEGQADKHNQLIEQTIHIADTYLNEGRYDSAKQWYEKALRQSELSLEKNTLRSAALMAKLAEVAVLQANMDEFEKCLENLQRAYLLSQETSTGTLLSALIDLSWALCVQGHTTEVHPVNDLITQIKQLEEEENLATLVA